LDLLFTIVEYIINIIIRSAVNLVMILILFVPVIVLLFLLHRASNYFQELQIKVLGFSRAVWFFSLGVVLHEASHFLACIFTGTPVGRVVLFSPSGKKGKGGGYTLGFVEHGRPAVPGGEILIALAPLIGISIVLVIAAKLLIPGFSMPSFYIEHGRSSLFSIPANYTLKLLISGWELLKNLRWLDVKTYIFLYLMLAVAPGIAPSREDFATFWKGIAILLGFLFGISVLLTILGIDIPGLNMFGVPVTVVLAKQVANLSSYLSLSLICCILGILIFHLILYLKKR